MNGFNITKINNREYNVIIYYVSIVVILVGLFMVIPIFNAILLHDSDKYLISFIISSLICIIVGLTLYLKTEHDNDINLSPKASLFFVMSIWLIQHYFSHCLL